MKTTLAFFVVLLAATPSCSQGAPGSQVARSGEKQSKPITLENCLALGEILEYTMTQASAGMRTAEIGSLGSAVVREEGISIARERLDIVEKLLDLFEKDAMDFQENPRVKGYLDSLPGYREQLTQHSKKLDRLSR